MYRPADRKITRACVDARYEEVRKALKGAPPPTARMRERAAEACVLVRPDVPSWSPLPFLGGLVVLCLVVVLILLAGCVPQEAIEQAQTEAAICHGHATDERVSEDGRAIGASEERAWRAQHVSLTGEDVPQALAEGWAPLESQAPRCPDDDRPAFVQCEGPNGPMGDPPTAGGCR